jgi:hypothetical protein
MTEWHRFFKNEDDYHDAWIIASNNDYDLEALLDSVLDVTEDGRLVGKLAQRIVGWYYDYPYSSSGWLFQLIDESIDNDLFVDAGVGAFLRSPAIVEDERKMIAYYLRERLGRAEDALKSVEDDQAVWRARRDQLRAEFGPIEGDIRLIEEFEDSLDEDEENWD